jgi:hypothetical protein
MLTRQVFLYKGDRPMLDSDGGHLHPVLEIDGPTSVFEGNEYEMSRDPVNVFRGDFIGSVKASKVVHLEAEWEDKPPYRPLRAKCGRRITENVRSCKDEGKETCKKCRI